MKTYYANFVANNGTRFMNPIKDTNLKRIIKGVRRCAESERFLYNSCSWSVWIYNRNGFEQIVAAGGMDTRGVRYRTT